MSKFITLVLVGLSSGLWAQTIAPKLGLSYSHSAPEYGVWTYEPQTHPRIGFTGGIAVDSPLSDKFSLQPEFLFLQKGYAIKDVFRDEMNNGISRMKDEVRLQVLELPVILKYHFQVGTTQMYAAAGPSISYYLKGTHYSSVSGKFEDNPEWNYSQRDSQNITFGETDPDFEGTGFEVADNRHDVGIQVGVGARIFDKLLVDVRYGQGFVALYEAHPFLNNSRENTQLRTLQITVGWPINLF
jgi:hypothetical protein